VYERLLMWYVLVGRVSDMSASYNPDEQKELKAVQDQLDAAKKSSDNRNDKVDDLTSRFRELRRQNHFRLMLEELFSD
jgi:hypothetical protein